MYSIGLAAKFLSVVLRKSSLFFVLKHVNIQVQHWVTWFSFLTIATKISYEGWVKANSSKESEEKNITED